MNDPANPGTVPVLIIWEENSPPYDPSAGGIATYIQHRARVLAGSGIEVWWASIASLARWSEAEQQWIDRRTVPCARWRRRLAMRWPALSPVWTELAAMPGTKIFEFAGGTTSWLPRVRPGVRVVLCCHTSTLTRAFLNRDGAMERRLTLFASWARRNLRRADGVLACSSEIAMLEAGYFHLHPDRLRILFHAFSRQVEPGGQTGAEPASESRDFLIAGNLEYFKGMDLIVAGFESYLRTGGRGKLLVAGCGGLEELWKPSDQTVVRAIRRLQKEHGTDCLHFLGRLDKARLAATRRRCAAVVIGSRFEAFTMVAGESFVQGNPVILSERTGWRSLAERYRAARLVDPYNAADIAAAMHEMDDPKTRISYIEGGHALAEYLTSPGLARETAEFYLGIAAK